MALHFVSYGFGGLVNLVLLEKTSAEHFEKLRIRTANLTSMDPTSYVVFFVTSLPWMHGLRTDLMNWFFLWNFKADANFLGKFGGLVLHCFAGNTGRLDWQTSFYLQTLSSGMISNFLKFLSTALQYLESFTS